MEGDALSYIGYFYLWKDEESEEDNLSYFAIKAHYQMHLMFHDQLENLMDELREKSRKNDGKMDIYALV